jgi:hypothetical protein
LIFGQIQSRPLFCGSAALPPDLPIRAELIKSVTAGRVKAGEAVFARVVIEWKGQGCTLRKGAILQGRIVSESERSRSDKSSELALAFDAA